MPVQYEKVQGGRDARAGDLQASILKAIKVAVFMAVIIAIAGIARVWLTTSAVDTQRQSNMIKTQISEQRAAGVALEVKYNSMTDPTVIEKAADSRLGMEPPKEATFIDLG
jgi:cell division protein FtsL